MSLEERIQRKSLVQVRVIQIAKIGKTHHSGFPARPDFL
jgi:hypothetical protein